MAKISLLQPVILARQARFVNKRESVAIFSLFAFGQKPPALKGSGMALSDFKTRHFPWAFQEDFLTRPFPHHEALKYTQLGGLGGSLPQTRLFTLVFAFLPKIYIYFGAFCSPISDLLGIKGGC